MKKTLTYLGILTITFSLFFDFLTGSSEIVFGKLQWIILFIGSLILLAGFFLPLNIFSRSNYLYKFSQNKFFQIIIGVFFKVRKKIDFFVIVLFILIGICFFLGRWQGRIPVLNLGSDAANVATYAAVLDHPENFKMDFFYNEKSNFSYYVSFHIPYLRFTSSIFGGYGLAYLFLLVPIIAIHGTGFYFLGKTFFKHRFWAFLLAISSLILIYTESADYWGIYQDPQPRMLFAALFPWALLLAYKSLEKPKLRYLSMIFTGLLLYVHPVSVPGVAFSIWLGFLVFKPKEMKKGRHLLEMLLLGLVFVVMAVPFIFVYLQSRDIVPKGVNYSEAMSYFASSGLAMFSVKETLLSFISIITKAYILPISILGMFISLFFTNKKRDLSLLLVWVLGLFFVAIGLTAIENLINKETGTIPILLELTRDLRYIVPLLEIAAFLPFADKFLSINTDTKFGYAKKYTCALIGIGILFALANGYREVTKDKLDMKMYAQQTINCVFTGKIFCSEPSGSDMAQLMSFIRESTNKNATFISLPPGNLGKQIRYQGLRSIVFDLGDVKPLGFVDIQKAISLKSEVDFWNSIAAIQSPDQKLSSYLQFAENLNANYAIVENSDNIDVKNDVVYSNNSYSVIQLTPP